MRSVHDCAFLLWYKDVGFDWILQLYLQFSVERRILHIAIAFSHYKFHPHGHLVFYRRHAKTTSICSEFNSTVVSTTLTNSHCSWCWLKLFWLDECKLGTVIIFVVFQTISKLQVSFLHIDNINCCCFSDFCFQHY